MISEGVLFLLGKNALHSFSLSVGSRCCAPERILLLNKTEIIKTLLVKVSK